MALRPPSRVGGLDDISPGDDRRGVAKVRVRVVERFPGDRLRQRTGPLRRIRSALALIIVAVIIGALVATALSCAVWGISVAIHHATTS